MSSREDPQQPGTSAAPTSQASPAVPQDNSQDNAGCPECRDISTECSSSCRHCFCRLCLWDWSLGEAVCRRCQRPTRHPYPQHVALYHEVQDRVYNSKQRRRGRSPRQPRSSSGHAATPERRRRSSVRWHHDGRWRSRHAQGSDSPRRRRRWWRRSWDDAPGQGQAPRSEGHIPGSSWSRSRHRFHRSWSHRRQGQSRDHRSRWRWWSRVRERSYGWSRRQDRSSRRGQDTQRGSRDHSSRQRRWNSCNADDRHAPRPQRDTPSGRRERHQWEDWDSSRQQHGTRSRTRGRSHRRGQDTQIGSQGTVPHDHSSRQRWWRSWNADEGQAPRSQQDIPSSSGRSRHRHGSQSHARHRDR